MKKCSKCKAEQAVTEFHKDKGRNDGLSNKCKACSKARAAAWRVNNHERVTASVRAWNAANKERKAATDAAWRLENKARMRATDKAWYEANKAKKANTP
jgi:hypothetical protein